MRKRHAHICGFSEQKCHMRMISVMKETTLKFRKRQKKKHFFFHLQVKEEKEKGVGQKI